MTTTKIAALVNTRENYVKRDRSDMTDYQIHGRTQNYPKLFLRNSTLVGLVGRDEDKMKSIQNEKSDPKNGTKTENNAETKCELNSETDSEPQTESEMTILNEINNSINNSLNEKDVTKISFLTENKFVELGTIGELISNGFPDNDKLNECGIYSITIPEDYRFILLDEETVQKNMNIVRPWSEQKLTNKWIDEVDVIYYGLAGNDTPRSLRTRLNDLLNHANGKTTDNGPHCGGEIIFHLSNWQNFNIWIMPTGNPPEPRRLETELLQRFFELKGQLPFGNRKF